MNEKLQGLTLEMKLDAIGVEEGMKGLKRQLGVVNSEMKANLSAFDKSEKSMEKYEAQIKGLNNRLKVQKQMFNQAEGELKKLNADYVTAKSRIKDVEKAYLNLAEANKKNKQALDKSTNALKESNSELKKAENQYKRTANAKQKEWEKLKELRKANKDYENSVKQSSVALREASRRTEAQAKEVERLKNEEKALKNTENVKASELRKANRATTEASEKLKKLQEEERKYRNENKAATTQLKKSTTAIETSSTKHKQLVQRYKEEGAQVDKLRNKNKSLSASNEKVKSTYDKTNSELKQTEQEFNKLNRIIKNHSADVAKAEKAVNTERTALNKLERTLSQATKDMQAFNKEQLISNSHFSKTANRADEMSKKFGTMGEKMSSVGRTMTVGVTTPITMGLGAAIKTSADFESQMSKVGAVSQASSKDLKAMSDQAVELGAKTSKSASEVAEGMNELASLGFNAQQIMKAMPGVISAAEASGADMATTASVMASSINSFNLKASESGHVADVLSMAANDSAADINYMGDALKYAGTPAHSLGVSLEDTSAAIEVMSNAGLEGSQAGTALRASFIRLASPTKKSKKAMDELGLSLTDSKGKFVGMPKLIEMFQNGLKGMTKEQKLATVSQIVGTEAASGFLALIEAGPKKVSKFSKSLKESDGASKKASDQMKNNLKGSLEQLGGAFESLGIQVGKDLTPAIRTGAHVVQKFVEGFSAMPGWVRKSAIAMTVFAGAIGPTILAGGLLLRAISSAAKGYASLNRQMAINTTEAAINAKANKTAAGSLATTGKSTKGVKGIFSQFGNVIRLTATRFSGLGNVLKIGTKILGKVGIPLTILTTIFGVAYEKMDWFKRGFSDMGKLVNQVGESIDFSWIHKMGKSWDNFKNDMAKGLQDGLLFKGIHKLFNGIHSAAARASDKVNVLGKGVSKETKSALGTYVKYSDQSDKIFEQIRFNHNKITKKQAEELISINKKMSSELISQLEDRKNKEIKLDHDVLDSSKVISEKRKQAIIQKATEEGNIRIKKAKELNKRIEDLESKAAKNGKLSKDEAKELQKLYEQRNNLAVKSLSKGEKEQQRILSRMSANRRAMSIKEASDTIKESIKAKNQAIKDAKKKYDAKVDEINQMVGLSKSEKNKILNEAQDQYDKEVKKAKSHHKTTLKNVKASNKNVEKEIDLSNGKVLTGMQKWFHGLGQDSKKAWNKMGKNAQHFGKIMSGSGKWFKGLKTSASNAFSGAGKAIAKHSKSAYSSATTWFGKTTSKSVTKFKDLKAGSDKWFGKIGSKIKSVSKSAYSNATNWFSKTTSKSVSKFKDLKAGSDKWWGKVGSKIKTTSKSAYSTATSWFSKTTSKSIAKFKDLKAGSDKWWGKVGSKIKSISKAAYSNATNWFNKTKNKSVGYFKDLKSGTDKWWGKVGSKIRTASKNAYNDARNWFSKTKSKSLDLFKDIKNATDKRWNSISSKIKDKSKEAYNSSKKWFTNAKNTALDRFKDMYNGAKKNFGNIVDQSEDKGKKTFGKWKSWLGKTLDWIKNIKGEFGDAASSLGKSVANKAIDGLNGMIGGINKIAKAITDKSLIKEIPKLSTGTVSGSSLATDSNGGVKAPTLAVVNDRGSGNAPGGGVQEVIHRGDGSLEAPQGKNTIIHLNKGDGVINAKDTFKLQRMGAIPKFASGSKKKNWLDNVKNVGEGIADGASKLLDGAKKGAVQASKVAKDKSKNVIDKAKEVGTDALKSAEDAAMGIWGGIKGVTKDVGEFLEHPGKLVNKVMDFMKINFGSGANATVQIAKGAYGILKKKLVDKVTSWFEEFGGDGDGSYIKYLDNITTPYSPNGPPPGYAFNWPHPGIDLPYHHEPILSTLNGRAYNKFMAGGFGKYILVKSGALEAFYGHLSKSIIKDGQTVHAGQQLGISGGDPGLAISGASTGPHLHYEMHENGHPIDPVKWLKSHMGGGKGGGRPKAGIKWAPQIKQALRMNGLPTSSAYVNAWARQIDSESSGNPNAVQGGYVDANTGGNEAKGLVQVAKNTFQSMKFPGHGNVFNPLDNLLAGIHWAKVRYGNDMLSVIGHGHGYATGGLIKNAGWYNIAEGGFPEWVIPTDPARRTDALKLLEHAAMSIRPQSTKDNKRPNQFSNLTNNSGQNKIDQKLDTLIGLIANIVKSNDTIANKDLNVTLDGASLNKNINKQQALEVATHLMGRG
ncbi:phage tail tape measure protein [Staphylococcus petrasii]|nr:phage tail tape measure protein [Staphylococcus petrasii]MCI2773410.1 phage tail tape measure protein [Staphylococcus petrasii]